MALGLQVLLVLLNKYSQWVGYSNAEDRQKKRDIAPYSQWIESVTDHASIDLVFDLASIVLLAIATWTVINYTGAMISE